jgi:Beta-lactamase enzyme family
LYFNRSAQEIKALLAEKHARMLDLEPTPEGLFDVVMVGSSRRSWWYVGRSSDALADLAAQNGARLTDVDKLGPEGDNRYVAIMVPNVRNETTRVNDLLRKAVGNEGHWGLYLKQVDGPELSAINAGRRFEPASSVKVLYHLNALYSEQADLSTLDGTEVTWYESLSGSCPTGESPRNDALAEVLRLMMQNSDNRATNAILERYGGLSGMNQFAAAALGAADTSVNHVIGCAGAALDNPNQLTLFDLGLMYERATNGSLLTPEAFAKFRQLMSTSRLSRMDGIVRGRRAGDGLEAVRGLAARMRVPTRRVERFLRRTRVAWKGGSYTLCTPECRYDWSLGGWTSIPFKTRSGVARRSYVFGMFAEDATSAEAASRAWDRGAEVLRPALRQALRTWR